VTTTLYKRPWRKRVEDVLGTFLAEVDANLTHHFYYIRIDSGWFQAGAFNLEDVIPYFLRKASPIWLRALLWMQIKGVCVCWP